MKRYQVSAMAENSNKTYAYLIDSEEDFVVIHEIAQRAYRRHNLLVNQGAVSEHLGPLYTVTVESVGV